MSWNKIYELLKAAAAISGLVAFFSIAYTMYKDSVSREKQAAASQELINRAWQENEIFRVIREAGVAGLNFDDVPKEVQLKWFSRAPSSAPVDSDAAVPEQVFRGVVALIGNGVITYGVDGRLRVMYAQASQLDAEATALRLKAYGDLLIKWISDAPGVHTVSDMRDFRSKQGLTNNDVAQIIPCFVYSGACAPFSIVVATGTNRDPVGDDKVSLRY